MKTKLTLSIRKEVLEKARTISKKRQTSLSALFEKTILLMENEKAAGIDPKVKALQGILKTGTGRVNKNEYYESYMKKPVGRRPVAAGK